MQNWKTVIETIDPNQRDSSRTNKTNTIQIKKGIYQGDCLSALWFCVALNPLSNLLRTTKIGFDIKSERRVLYKINHLVYMDDLKLYAASKNKLNELIQIVAKFSSDIQMKFGIDKCRFLSIHAGRMINTQEQGPMAIEPMSTDELYKYLGVMQSKQVAHSEMKKRLQTEFKSRLHKLMKSKLNGKNLVKAPLSEPSPIQDKPSVSALDHSQPPDASPSLNSTTACNNLLIIGDSHCRDLTAILKTFAPPNCKVNCIAMPVVSAIHVLNKLEPNTNICVVAGTNDIFKTPFDNLVKSYSVLHEKCKQFKIFVVLPPPRYDVRNIISHILKINCKIKHHINQYNNFTYIDPKTFLHMGTYSQDRLHLNGKGKQKLCMNIMTKVHGRVTGRPSSDVMHRIDAQHESRTQHKLTKYRQARHTTLHTRSPAPSRNIPSLLHLNTNPHSVLRYPTPTSASVLFTSTQPICELPSISTYSPSVPTSSEPCILPLPYFILS
ncbi:hypothetical protein M8J76_015424 [Diaphorina citri]|nr:hypothetical protein M8J76_015424 [Diaphorina citri]